ncbi:MAG: NAD(P)-dependent oxidoreductase [Blautia sp.]
MKRTDFDMAYMVLAASGNRELDEEIYRLCKDEGIYVKCFGEP